jgi:hypothetical protein
MEIPSNISDDCADALVELCFLCLPAVDPDELAGFIGAILRIAECEVLRAVAEERRRASEQMTRQSWN